MSRIDAKCYPSDIQSGAGEMNCLKPVASFPTDSTSLGQAIASEIVNEIFDAALDTAMAHSRPISPDLVGDILDNLMAPGPDRDDTILLDDKLKKMINEMKFPPIVGLGDNQPAKITEIPPPAPTNDTKHSRNTLERKKRLTNLVKNSKHILTKFVKNEDNAARLLKSSKSEESYEKLVRSINLDFADEQSGSKTAPRNLHFPVECSMDVVDLTDDDDGQVGSKRGGGKKKLKLKNRILQFFKVRRNTSSSGTITQKSPRRRDDETSEN